MNRIIAFSSIIAMATTVNAQETDSIAVGQDTITVMFWGDMMSHTTQVKAAYDATNDTYDYNPCFAKVKEAISNVDIAVCNLECTLAGKPYKGYPCFSAPDQYFEAMVNSGFDVFLTANNHCIDTGKKGLELTVDKLLKREIVQIGTYKDSTDRAERYPAIIDVRGVKIAMLCYTYGTNGIKVTAPNVVNYTDTVQIRLDIEESKRRGADYIIANMHWGIEYEHTPRKSQKELAHWLIDNGVDHVIGGHPHVVQPAEIYKGNDGKEHFIVYSLGNVLANTQQEGGDGGIAVTLRLPSSKSYEKPDVSYSIYHTARPAWSKVTNYTIFPEGYAEELPQGEKPKMDTFIESTLKVMSEGDDIKRENMK